MQSKTSGTECTKLKKKTVSPLEKPKCLNKSLEPTRWNVIAQKVKDPSSYQKKQTKTQPESKNK